MRCHAQRQSEATHRAFITPDLFLPNIHDLYQSDCKIWGIIRNESNRQVQDVNDLRQRLIDACTGVKLNTIDDATDQRQGRLSAQFEPEEDKLNIHCNIINWSKCC